MPGYSTLEAAGRRKAQADTDLGADDEVQTTHHGTANLSCVCTAISTLAAAKCDLRMIIATQDTRYGLSVCPKSRKPSCGTATETTFTANGVMPFLYGSHISKAHVGRWTEDCPSNVGVIVSDVQTTILSRTIN